MRTEKDRMLAGEMYLAMDPQLVQERLDARALTRQYNATLEIDFEQRTALLRQLLGSTGENITHLATMWWWHPERW